MSLSEILGIRFVVSPVNDTENDGAISQESLEYKEHLLSKVLKPHLTVFWHSYMGLVF